MLLFVTLFFNIAAYSQDNNNYFVSSSNISASVEEVVKVYSVNSSDANNMLVSYLDSGITYRYGGTSSKVMDCSAFVGKVFRETFQINLPRTSREMALLGSEPDTLRLFDLVFFSKNGSTISHVGIYVGDGIFIHCSSSGKTVMVSALDEYGDRFMYGKRIIAQVGPDFLFTRVPHKIEGDSINNSEEKIVEENVQDEKLEVYQEGVASYYGGKFHGRKTASGERYDKNELTAAHKNLPFGTKVKVTNTSSGKSVIVTINDRGPYAKGRVIDLSEAAMKEINENGGGLCKVTLTVI